LSRRPRLTQGCSARRMDGWINFNTELRFGSRLCFHLHVKERTSSEGPLRRSYPQSQGRVNFIKIKMIDKLQRMNITIARAEPDGTRAETRFRLSPERTSPFKSAGASVQSTTGSPGVRISVSNAGYSMFRGSVKSTGYPLHSPVSPSLPLPYVTVCHHIPNAVHHR
jgi:hypothetical protein